MTSADGPAGDRAAAWATWRVLTKTFKTWRFFVPRLGDLHVATKRIGNDYATDTSKLSYWQAAEDIVAPLGLEDLNRLIVIARLNLAQLGVYLRAIVVGYFTVPVASALAWSQLFPASWARFAENPFTIIGPVIVWSLVFLLYAAGYYRGREILAFLEFEHGMRTAGDRTPGGPDTDV